VDVHVCFAEKQGASTAEGDLLSYSCAVDEEPQDGHGFPCPAATPQNNTPNNTFVSRRDYRHGAMLLVDRARGTDGGDRPQQGQGHVKRNQRVTSDPGQPMVYQIRIKGHLGRQWTNWFGDLAITALDNGETLLTGSVKERS